MAARGIIARLLLDEGVIDEEQLRYAERVHLKLATEKPLAEVLQELFSIPVETIYTTLREHGTEIRLGELLVELGHLTPEHLEAALAIQREEPGSKTRLGEVLVEHQFIDEGGLVNILSLHLGVPTKSRTRRRSGSRISRVCPSVGARTITSFPCGWTGTAPWSRLRIRPPSGSERWRRRSTAKGA